MHAHHQPGQKLIKIDMIKTIPRACLKAVHSLLKSGNTECFAQSVLLRDVTHSLTEFL